MTDEPKPVMLDLHPARATSSASLELSVGQVVSGQANGQVVLGGGGSAVVVGGKVEDVPALDRRPFILWCLAWAVPGRSVGEHSLHGPWLLRWGLGGALGAAVGAWLWDVLKPRERS
jgi:hypothetical protein